MAEHRELTELERIAGIFQKHGVEFVVIGGQAEVLHGSPRVTYDVDLCYRRTKENIQRLAIALVELEPSLRNAPKDLPFKADARALEAGCNFTFNTNIIDLDLLGYVEPIGGFDELRKTAILYKSHGLDLWTTDVDDLLKIKRHINRAKDQESIAQLLAIQRIRQENPPSP